jgi:hypothetical protein
MDRDDTSTERSMSLRGVERLALPLWTLSAGLVVAGVWLGAAGLDLGSWLELLVGLAFATTGALLGWRRPHNPIGWLFAGWGAVMALDLFTQSYVRRGLVDHPGSLPGGGWLAWALTTLWHPAYMLLALVMLLFPHGRLLSPRWRPLACLVVAGYLALAVAAALSPAAMRLYFPHVSPVVRLPVASIADQLFDALLPAAQLCGLGVGAAALLVRLRRTHGAEHQQVKWFIYTVVVVVVVFISTTFLLGAGYLFPIFAAIPVAAAIAILRHHLYDIDRLINRTVVYGLLTALLGAIYGGIVLGLGQAFGGIGTPPGWAVAGATLAVAALFQPARRRVQAAVDRRFNRGKYNAARTIEAFSARLRDEIDLDSLATELLAVIDQTMQPTRRSLFERTGIDPARLSYDDIPTVPITPKEAVRDDPEAFVRRGAKPAQRIASTGTTGWPTAVWLSEDELHVQGALTAIGGLISGRVLPEDVVHVAISSRAQVGVSLTARAAAAIGAAYDIAGLIAPEQTLALLASAAGCPGTSPA